MSDPQVQQPIKSLYVLKSDRSLPGPIRRAVVPTEAVCRDDTTELWEGNLEIHDGAKLVAPALKEVTGSITLGKGAALYAPKLEEIDGTVTMRPETTLGCDALRRVGGKLTIWSDGRLNASHLAEASSIELRNGAKLDVPSLARVEKGVILCENVKLDATVLTHTGFVTLLDSKLNAPALASLDGKANAAPWSNVEEMNQVCLQMVARGDTSIDAARISMGLVREAKRRKAMGMLPQAPRGQPRKLNAPSVAPAASVEPER